MGWQLNPNNVGGDVTFDRFISYLFIYFFVYFSILHHAKIKISFTSTNTQENQISRCLSTNVEIKEATEIEDSIPLQVQTNYCGGFLWLKASIQIEREKTNVTQNSEGNSMTLLSLCICKGSISTKEISS